MTLLDLVPITLTALLCAVWAVYNGKLQYDLMRFDPVYGFIAWAMAIFLGWMIAMEVVA